ncbi:sugar ABC transporter permease [Agromyces atrinae]|uniref:carbohydrate ABC transporter permease n=1 Tax=Agromyces atrinae TaxID=592376 RepID=UPI001F56E1ED|nr:sugar ABC transporter permease [Agromyces atrinae]MCI2957005.1 sugar ABC transporter permease [Agromyces atrinae]
MALSRTAARPPHLLVSRKERWARRSLVSPSVLALLVLGAYPLLFIIAASVSDSSLGKPFRAWTGTENFETVLADGDVVASLWRTVAYALAVSLASVALGVVAAVALERATRGGSIVKTILLLPLIIPPVVVGTLWKLIFNPGGGLLSTIVEFFGGDGAALAPLSSTAWALPAIALTDVWEWTPLVILLVYTSLLGQDEATREAAALDGAHGWRLFRSITLPAIAGAVAAAFFIRLVIAFKVFDLVFVMTSGGPGQATTTTSYLIYQVALKEFDVGRASAITLLLAVVVTLVTLPIVALTRKVHRDA